MALKVIVVEDRRDVAGALREHLRDLGHEVFGVASNAADLADLLRQHEPDLVTIDLDLGEQQDGMGIAILLEAAGVVPVVFITNPDDSQAAIEESRTIECTARLRRPFTRADLAVAIDRAVQRAGEVKHADL